jgi:putative membrane protein
MAKPFLTDEAKRALSEAVTAVEAVSSAELVIAVRPRSGSYLHADLIAATGAALATLLVLLFSPWTFELVWFVIDPVLAGILAGALAARWPALRRLLTSPAVRRRQVEVLARSLFLEKGVHKTRGRTGILVYLSLLEREAEVVVDAGVEPLLSTESWQREVREIRAAVRRGEDGVAVATRLHELALLLGAALVRAEDDVDELSNEVTDR